MEHVQDHGEGRCGCCLDTLDVSAELLGVLAELMGTAYGAELLEEMLSE